VILRLIFRGQIFSIFSLKYESSRQNSRKILSCPRIRRCQKRSDSDTTQRIVIGGSDQHLQRPRSTVANLLGFWLICLERSHKCLCPSKWSTFQSSSNWLCCTYHGRRRGFGIKENDCCITASFWISHNHDEIVVRVFSSVVRDDVSLTVSAILAQFYFVMQHNI
jgi:hypothetical protein